MNRKKDVGKKPDTAIIVAIIALVGTLITAVLTSPVLIAIISRTPSPTLTETPSTTFQSLTPDNQSSPTADSSLPTFKPQNFSGKIAFSSTKDNTRGLYLLDAQDKSVLPIAPKLTENLDSYFHFKWSPDGKKILYSGFLPQAGLYIFDIENNQSSFLTDKPAFSFDWSPTGNQIVFSTMNYSNGLITYGQYVLDLTTKNYQPLASFSPEVSGMTDGIAWSPNNSEIAFSAWTETDDSSLDIFSVNPNGANLRNITNYPKGEAAYKNLAWSPDSKYLAMMTENSIILISSDSAFKTLYSSQEVSISPDKNGISWSPDSTKIIFDDLYNVIRIVNIKDGTITTMPLKGSCPNWSPDGKNIIFVSPGLNGNEILLNNDNGTEKLTDNMQVECAKWQP